VRHCDGLKLPYRFYVQSVELRPSAKVYIWSDVVFCSESTQDRMAGFITTTNFLTSLALVRFVSNFRFLLVTSKLTVCRAELQHKSRE
jgi:hypothetical protein